MFSHCKSICVQLKLFNLVRFAFFHCFFIISLHLFFSLNKSILFDALDCVECMDILIIIIKETTKTCKSISLLYTSLVASTRQSTSVRCYQASFNDDLRAIKRCFVNINETKQFFVCFIFFFSPLFLSLILGTRQTLSLGFALFPILCVFI